MPLPSALLLLAVAGILALTPRAEAASAVPGPTAVPGATIAPLFPDLFDSDVVQRVQELLAGLGLYRGPTDGTMSEATRQAIGEYQRASGLPVDGEPTKALIAHLESAAGQGQRLLKRLDEIKEEQIRAARAGLLARPETRALVTPEAGPDRLGVADPTRDPSACFKNPTTACLLGEALESTRAIPRPEFRDWALGDIIQVHTRLGDFVAAWRMAGLIQDARAVVNALGSIARDQTEVGAPAEAVETARLIPDARLRGETLLAIAETLIQRGKAAEARPILAEALAGEDALAEPRQAVGFLSRLAVAEVRLDGPAAGRRPLDQARRALAAIDGEIDRATAIAALAAALAATGDTAAALASIGQIGEEHLRGPAQIAVVAAQVGQDDMVAALATARSIADARYRVTALTRIATRQVVSGARADGLRTIDDVRSAAARVEFGYARSFALSQLAELLVMTAAYDEATTLVEKIEDERLRAQVLWQIASARQSAGDRAGFETSWAATTQAIATIPSAPDRSWMLATIAIEEARHGDRTRAMLSFQRAVEAVSGITNPWFRARSLSRLALALAEIQ